MNIWNLPQSACIGGKTYQLHTDYRDILEIFHWFSREDIPLWVRWQIAIRLFYSPEVPQKDWIEAATYLSEFISYGSENAPGPKLFDWSADSDLIICDINRVCGQEIRALPYLHWWTFLSYFHAIGDGQLATMIALRRKLMTNQKLSPWEQELCRAYRHRLHPKTPLTPQERSQKEKLEALLN